MRRVTDGPADPRAAGLEDGPDGGLHPDEVGSAGVARIHQDADELPAGLRGRVGAVEPAEYGARGFAGAFLVGSRIAEPGHEGAARLPQGTYSSPQYIQMPTGILARLLMFLPGRWCRRVSRRFR